MNNEQFDILIVGGGLVGASLACALNNSAFKIALIESKPHLQNAKAHYDDRAIALSLGSQRIFQNLALWSKLQPLCYPIKTIHVSERSRFGITRLKHKQEGVESLGQVISARNLGKILSNHISSETNITLFCPAKVENIRCHSEHVSVAISTHDKPVTAKIVVAADGGHSFIRQQLEIKTIESDYHQTAIVANVSSELENQNIAYERFTRSGPLAILPIDTKRSALVWTHTNESADKILNLSDTEFLQELYRAFGRRLGQFTRVGKRHSFPLKLIRAEQQVYDRIVLIGNAAHTLHPIAGQGFNLGLRDVACLAETLMEAAQNNRDIEHKSVLKAYAHWREKDQRHISYFTDGLVRIFSNNVLPLSIARNIGLITLDLLPPLKHILAKNAMGLAGRQPKLVRGQAL